MSGRLIILPHKSWNVYNRDNVEKVKADERKHAEQEDKKRRRSELAEQEARVTAMRAKVPRLGDTASSSGGKLTLPASSSSRGGGQVVASRPASRGHINFFEELEAGGTGLTTGGKNPEYEAEKKVEQEKWDRQITTYLGQSAAETQKVKPWYFDASERPVSEEKLKKDKRLKDLEDPLVAMAAHVEKKRSQTKAAKASTQPGQSAETAVERLRRERLEREQQERERLSKLFPSSKDAPPTPQPRAPSGYNSTYAHFHNR
eukprot:gnl/Hemi2/27117_TR9107_c0_g1_i2.p1 gnl/Hemi2/27117_TR9107_c0_g1~~gnl/Hemi2/27117_TR9107_c0_g1_i2.p1  ORF type:complete len:260 (+),score=51.96 gnl/Hemi2/27117_TR9107_c0_g1_i2:113-892(+)